MKFSARTFTIKAIRRRLRKMRDSLATRFFDTRLGRELLVSGIGPRVLTMTVDCGDHLMTVSPSDYIGRKVFRKGHFERDHVDRLLVILRERGLLRKGSVLLELGGNIGTQTVYFALSGAYRHIVTVEPGPDNFRLLAANIRQNRLEEKVTAINCAAGDRHGEVDFFLDRNNHGRSSMLRRVGGKKITVPVRTVPEILESAGLAATDIGLVWMDIEGYEPVACRSMEALMANRVPLYTEFTPELYGRDQAADFISLLSRCYQNCLVFSDDGVTAMKAADLPVDGEQFDVLFLR